MNKLFRMLSLLLAVSMLMSIGLSFAAAEEVIDADLTCTITLGNWPPDTAPQAEKDLFEGYKATMAKQYPNVTLVPDYYSYSLSNYVPMAKGGTAPSIFQPPFTDPQLLISQHLVGDVTDALEKFGVLEQFSPSYVEMLADKLILLHRDEVFDKESEKKGLAELAIYDLATRNYRDYQLAYLQDKNRFCCLER